MVYQNLENMVLQTEILMPLNHALLWQLLAFTH